MKQVLFLSSANYYRSRFAEHLFNRLASQAGLSWRAISRGLLVGKWGDGGPISSIAVAGLRSHGILLEPDERNPRPLHQRDLVGSAVIIAVKETEHRPLMNEQFPDWADLVDFWYVDDVDCAEPDEALPLLASKVQELVDQLASGIATGEAVGEPALS